MDSSVELRAGGSLVLKVWESGERQAVAPPARMTMDVRMQGIHMCFINNQKMEWARLAIDSIRFVFKMMSFVFKMMNSVFTMMDFLSGCRANLLEFSTYRSSQQTISCIRTHSHRTMPRFVENMMNFALNIMNFALKMILTERRQGYRRGSG